MSDSLPFAPLRLEWRSPAELAENPANWRRHPTAQLAALTDVIAEVGWAGACLLNERTGRLIDGHARRKVAVDQGVDKVPVLVGDWTEDQERKILATLDPIAGMAEADAAALDALLRGVQTGSEAIATMLDGLCVDVGIVPEPERLSDLPDLGRTETHTITVRYGPDDAGDIRAFIGLAAGEPFDPVRTGRAILERIKDVVAGGADRD